MKDKELGKRQDLDGIIYLTMPSSGIHNSIDRESIGSNPLAEQYKKENGVLDISFDLSEAAK